MRFAISPAQLKKLASRLGAWIPSATHSQLLDLLSRGFGWRDWHEASTAPAEHREGQPGPLAVNKAWQTVGHVRDIGHDEFCQQMHGAFADMFGRTCPMLANAPELLSVLALIGCTDAPAQSLKVVCQGLPAAQIHSGLYRLSQTGVLGANRPMIEEDGYLACDARWGVRPCEGAELNPEENPRARDPRDLLEPNQYSRWRDTTPRRSWDEPVYRAGYSFEPFCFVCENMDTLVPCGMLMGAWEVQCPAEIPHYNGTLHLHAAVVSCEEALWLLGSSLPFIVGDAINSALWGLAGCPSAQLTVRVLMANPNEHTRDIAQTCFDLLSDGESLAPCLRAARARLELLENKDSGVYVVEALPAREVPFARQGPALKLSGPILGSLPMSMATVELICSANIARSGAVAI